MATSKAAPVYVSYALRTLADLEAFVQSVRMETRVAEGNKPVADDCIYLRSAEYNEITAVLQSERLSDGSQVYNVTFGAA